MEHQLRYGDAEQSLQHDGLVIDANDPYSFGYLASFVVAWRQPQLLLN